MRSPRMTLPKNGNSDNRPEGCFQAIENRELIHQRFPFCRAFDNPSFTSYTRDWKLDLVNVRDARSENRDPVESIER